MALVAAEYSRDHSPTGWGQIASLLASHAPAAEYLGWPATATAAPPVVMMTSTHGRTLDAVSLMAIRALLVTPLWVCRWHGAADGLLRRTQTGRGPKATPGTSCPPTITALSDSESTSKPGTAAATDDWWRWRSFQKPTSSSNPSTPARTTVISATEASLRPATATTKLHPRRSRDIPRTRAIDALARQVNSTSQETVRPTCHLSTQANAIEGMLLQPTDYRPSRRDTRVPKLRVEMARRYDGHRSPAVKRY
jgi:hypothetical protein